MTISHRGFVAGFCVGLVVVIGMAGLPATQGVTGKRAINLPGRTVTRPFSDAVLAGDTLYLAGRLGLERGRLPATVEAEVRNIMDSIQAVLAEADMTMGDLVQIQVYCADVSLFGQFNAVYTTYFSEAPPARAFLGSGPLLAGARFEVMGIAVRG